MLKVENVSKKFGTKEALKNISFSLRKGEITALLGENGAGKSTLLRVISGFFEPSEGKIWADSLSMSENRLKLLRKIGYVQEVSSLYGDMTVFEFLDFTADLREISRNEAPERIRETVKFLELEDVVTQRIDTLSKGFKKRVELAAVMLAQPEIMLLDEPTEGLDPNQKESVRKIIKKYGKSHTVLISTHTMEDVEAIAARVILVHKGKLEADAKIGDFKKIANNDLLASFRKITAK